MKHKTEITENQIKQLIREFVISEFENLSEYMKTIPEKERIQILLKVLPYASTKSESQNERSGDNINWKALGE